ncbi:hypothetical protein LINGRAHAP2_LOCUS9677, partial [Linum grandiflorum]
LTSSTKPITYPNPLLFHQSIQILLDLATQKTIGYAKEARGLYQLQSFPDSHHQPTNITNHLAATSYNLQPQHI